VGKEGCVKKNYAILFSGMHPPMPMPNEYPEPREEGMRDAIQVMLEKKINGIDPRSRIHLRAMHCCQQNWRIYPIGTIAEASWETLWDHHLAVIDDGDGGIPPLGGSPSPPQQSSRGSKKVKGHGKNVYYPQ
jgi:hypothetical protein